MKLNAPRQHMKTRKPVGPSERCGVMTAEKIFGSSGRSALQLLSPFIRPIIRNSDAQAHTPPKNAAAQVRPATAGGGAQGQGGAAEGRQSPPRRRSQGRAWRTAAMDNCG